MSKGFFKGPTIHLKGMLEARETRADRQYYLLNKGRQPLLAMTLNLPGPVKNSQEIKTLTEGIVADLADLFPKESGVLSLLELRTGPEYYQLINGDGLAVKRQLVKFEEEHPYGRLLDLDVLVWDEENQRLGQISRKDLGLPPRRCFICNEEAKVCSRSRRHSVREMQTAVCQLIEKGQEK